MKLKKKTVFTELPPEVGKTYVTKMATAWKVTVDSITYSKATPPTILGIKVIWENSPHLGPCPFRVENLILDKVKSGEVDTCPHCNKEITPDEPLVLTHNPKK